MQKSPVTRMVIENVRGITPFSSMENPRRRCTHRAEKVDLHTPQRPSEGNRSDGCRSSMTKRRPYDFPTCWKNRCDRLNRNSGAKCKTYMTFLFLFLLSHRYHKQYSYFSRYFEFYFFMCSISNVLVIFCDRKITRCLRGFHNFFLWINNKLALQTYFPLFPAVLRLPMYQSMKEFNFRRDDLSFRDTRAFPTTESLLKSQLSARADSQNQRPAPSHVPRPKNSCEVFECAIVSPAIVSAVYQIAAVNPVTGGRARRRKTAAGDRKREKRSASGADRAGVRWLQQVMTGAEGCAVAWK